MAVAESFMGGLARKGPREQQSDEGGGLKSQVAILQALYCLVSRGSNNSRYHSVSKFKELAG